MRLAIRAGIAVAVAFLGAADHDTLTEARSERLVQQGRPTAATSELEVLQLRENVFLIAGAGGHITVQV